MVGFGLPAGAVLLAASLLIAPALGLTIDGHGRVDVNADMAGLGQDPPPSFESSFVEVSLEERQAMLANTQFGEAQCIDIPLFGKSAVFGVRKWHSDGSDELTDVQLSLRLVSNCTDAQEQQGSFDSALSGTENLFNISLESLLVAGVLRYTCLGSKELVALLAYLGAIPAASPLFTALHPLATQVLLTLSRVPIDVAQVCLVVKDYAVENGKGHSCVSLWTHFMYFFSKTTLISCFDSTHLTVEKAVKPSDADITHENQEALVQALTLTETSKQAIPNLCHHPHLAHEAMYTHSLFWYRTCSHFDMCRNVMHRIKTGTHFDISLYKLELSPNCVENCQVNGQVVADLKNSDFAYLQREADELDVGSMLADKTSTGRKRVDLCPYSDIAAAKECWKMVRALWSVTDVMKVVDGQGDTQLTQIPYIRRALLRLHTLAAEDLELLPQSLQTEADPQLIYENSLIKVCNEMGFRK